MTKQFRDFESAREFVRKLNLKSQKEWLEYCKSGNKPDDIPRNPHQTYKKDFKGVGDWLGNEWRSFVEAREFVRSLKLKGQIEWIKYCKSGSKPDDIPSSPKNNYKKDFKGMGDWLGTGAVSNQFKQFLPFLEAREFVRSLGLKTQKEWWEYSMSGNKPDNMPTNPPKTYKKDFKGMGDWLGTGAISNQFKQFLPFLEARDLSRTLNLKSGKEWEEYCMSGNKPDNMPTNPPKTYKKDFKGWGDFLGTGNVKHGDRQFRPFKDARDFVRSLNLKGTREWNEYCKSGNKPDDIPSAPWNTYKEWNKK